MKRYSYLDSESRKAALILVVVLLTAFVLFYLAGQRSEATDSDEKSEKKDWYNNYDDTKEDAELFYFDPNTADSIQLRRLGIRPSIIRNIYRYRAKGGVFSKKEDFAKLYGLTVGQYKRLAPYIRISEDYRPAAEVYGNRDYANTMERREYPANATTADSMAHPVKIKQGDHININTADTTQLCMVPGIGRYFARKIWRYREKLGGFVSAEQLYEIEGFPESAIPYFVFNATAIKKIKINSATQAQLRAHPYIDFRQARDISDYRRLRGNIRNERDLKAVRCFTDNGIQQLLPYVDFE